MLNKSPLTLKELLYQQWVLVRLKKNHTKFLKQLVKVASIKCAFDAFCLFLNPLLHRLFLDHDIIFLSLDNIEKHQEKFRLSFEYF